MSPRPRLRRLFPMKRMACLAALLLVIPLPLPHHRVHAQTLPELSEPDGADRKSTDEGFSLMEEGAQLLLRGLFSELEPAFSEMDQALRELAPQLEAIGPQLAEVARMMGDVRNYDMPVMLENGDILIRRTAPLPPGSGLRDLMPSPDQQAPDGQSPDRQSPGLPPGLPGPDGQIEL